MSVIEANIIIDLPDYVEISSIVAELQSIVSDMNGKNTHINVMNVDNPLSLSPTQF